MVIPGIYRVDGVRGGNVYILSSKEGLTIIDTGLPGNDSRIISYLEDVLGSDPEDVIYIILRGEVAIKTYGKTILKLSCGDCIGEMEIFGHDRYMASAEVTKHSLLLCVKVDKSIFENPVCLRFLLGNLYSKNRRLDQSLVFILEKKSLW